jgi:hypothetical protein
MPTMRLSRIQLQTDILCVMCLTLPMWFLCELQRMRRICFCM